MEDIRIQRINSEIKKALSIIVSEKLNDPRLTSLMTISEVNTTSDLSHCKVKVGVLAEPNVQKDILAILKKSKGFIRHELASSVRLRITPELNFEIDEGYAHSIRINDILSKLNIPKENKNDDIGVDE
ncbi:MAG: 30S ribosome-binding factor RbfA [Clostridia bacterium]